MTAFDQFDPFERRITEAIEEIAAARPPAYLDDVLRQTARTSQRRRWTFSERLSNVNASRIAPVALAAAFVAAVGAAVIFTSVQTTAGPSAPPSKSVAATPGPSSKGAVWTAIYARRSTDGASVQIIALAPDGSQRVVRSIATSGPEALDVAPVGGVSQTGAAYLYWGAFASTATGSIAVFDLAMPSEAPTLISMGAPTGPRWSATGLLAIPGYNPSACTSSGPECWARVTILDPRTGAVRSLGGLGLFGGGPSIVWTRDGSGIWDSGRLKPIDGGQDVPFSANALFMDRRIGMGGLQIEDGGTIFGWDGLSRLSVTETVASGKHAVAVHSLPASGTGTVVAQGELPDGAYDAQLGEPDPTDSEFPIFYSTGPTGSPTFNEGPVLHKDGTLTQPFAGEFLGWVPAALAASWPTTP